MNPKPEIPKSCCVSFPVLPHDMGPERTMAHLKEIGFDHLMICCGIYTGYRLVMPRNPERAIYSLEEGLQYYRPNPSHYDETSLRPQASADFADLDVLGGAVEHGRRLGLSVGAWLPLFANGRLAKQRPEAAVQNLYGSRDRLFLCYNNPDVLGFVRGMVRDVVLDYGVDVVETDKIPQTQLELNAFAGRIDPVLRLAGSFCFCAHCERKAAELGFDLAAMRRHARRLAEESLRIPPHVVNALADQLQGDAEAPLLMLDEPLIYDLLRLRMLTVRQYLAGLREEVRAMNPRTLVSACFVPPFKIGHDASQPRAWLCGQSYRNVADVVDYINSVIHWERDVVEYDTRRAAAAVAGRCGLNVHVPAYGRFSPQQTPLLAQTALDAGADAVSFFCYDLMSEDMVRSVGAWLAQRRA
jgi:hypothetical protein